MAGVTSKIMEIFESPFALGLSVAVINGVLASKRGQAIEQDTLLAIAVPTVIAETYLAYKNPPKGRSVQELMFLTAAGLFVGLAPFVRWDPSKRAFAEGSSVPAPATLAELHALGCRYC